MISAHWLRGDTRTVLAAMADAGIVVDLIVTSPPFLNLRSYLPADDPAKALEIGSEATPADFIDTLLDVTEGCERVLAPHGSIAVELGDTFGGSGGAGGDYADGGLRAGQPAFTGSGKARRTGDYPVRDDYPRPARTRPDGNGKAFRGGERLPDCVGDGWPATKSLCLIPELYRVALAYGFNPLTGRRTRPWRVRNTVRWVRPNPPVGQDGDKFRPATSDIVIACRTDEAGRRRYWDGDAVRTPAKYGLVDSTRPGDAVTAGYTAPGQSDRMTRARTTDGRINSNPAGAPLLDWWKIAASGYAESHYATFPPALVEPLIKAMCPQRVCTACGEPSRRIVGKPAYVPSATYRGGVLRDEAERVAEGVNQWKADGNGQASVVRQVDTLGWTDCGCSTDGSHWRPGIVLDPFAGSGTTLAVAVGHGRDAIGIDLDERNIRLACDRVGPMFFNETTVDQLAADLGARDPADGAVA